MSQLPESAARLINQHVQYWTQRQDLIYWHRLPQQTVHYSQPPCVSWFDGGQTNLCFNAVDQHLATRSRQAALVYVQANAPTKRWNFHQLYREVNRCAGLLQALGVGRGDRVLVHLPVVPEAVFALLACARLGAIHASVLGATQQVNSSQYIANCIDDLQPKVMVCAGTNSQSDDDAHNAAVLADALKQCQQPPQQIVTLGQLLLNASFPSATHAYANLRAEHMNAELACEWLASAEASEVLYAAADEREVVAPLGIQRDTAGYAVALAAAMKDIFDVAANDIVFATASRARIAGLSNVIYGPLISGQTLVLFHPAASSNSDAWAACAKEQQAQIALITTADFAETQQRNLMLPEPLGEPLNGADKTTQLPALRRLFVSAELPEHCQAKKVVRENSAFKSVTRNNVADNSDVVNQVAVTLHYQLAEIATPLITAPRSLGIYQSTTPYAGQAVNPLPLALYHPTSGALIDADDQTGVLCIDAPLPPGCIQTVWGNNARFMKTYWREIPGRTVYCSFCPAKRLAQTYLLSDD